MKRTWKVCIGAGFASALLIPFSGIVSQGTVSAAGTGEVTIDEKHFPDEEFRNYVKQFDKDKNGAFSEKEIKNVKEIDCSELPVSSLEGIEYFVDLQQLSGDSTLYHQLDLHANTELLSLFWTGGTLSILDLSANTKLENLFLDNCGVSKLDVSKNTKLQYLHCIGNGISKLDLSKNPDLVDLTCMSEALTALDVSKNLKLASLSCMENPIKELDLSNHEDLERLNCDGCPITKLDISGCTNLKELDYSRTKLTKSIDTSGCPNLVLLGCTELKIPSLDVSHNLNLEYLFCAATSISELDISKNTKLWQLSVSSCPISVLKLGENSQLSDLDIEGCTEIKEIDFSKLPNLSILTIRGTRMKNLDFSKMPNIMYLNCDDAGLETLDLQKCPELLTLFCSGNELHELNLKNCPKLMYLQCGKNKLEELDLSKNSELVQLGAEANNLRKISLPPFNQKTEDVKLVELRLNRLTEKPNLPSDVTLNIFPQIQDMNVTGLRLFKRDKNVISLTWKMPEGFKEEDENNYYFEVWRSTSQSGTYEKCGDAYTTFYEDKNTRESVTYFYKVRMVYDLVYVWYPGPEYGDFSGVLCTDNAEPSFEDFVERLYSVALNRASDPEGKAFWIKQVVEEGKTGADCARFFLLDAPEFMNRNLPVEDFVETLYATFFDRASDEAGKKGWVEAISSGKKTRAEVVNDFIESNEWCDVCATYGVKSGAKWHKATKPSTNAKNFATRLYTCCLKRDPEQGGLQYWALALTNLEKTGAEAAQFFFEGEEFVGFNTSDIEYLTRLYTTFMDREPSVEELNYWVGEMKAGKQTRKSILAFFAQSPEFTAICKKYGIERGVI